MINKFSRTEMFIGSQGIMSLKAATVVVLGARGVGSYTIEVLVRYGMGRLVLVSNDTIFLTNVNRQSTVMHNAVGRPKTQVMKRKIADPSLDTWVIISEQFVLPQDLDTLFETIKSQMEPSGCVSYTLDTIDAVIAKLVLVSYAQGNEIPIISPMNTGDKLHPELFGIPDIL